MDSKFPQDAATAESGNGRGTHNNGKAPSIELFATGIVGLDDILGEAWPAITSISSKVTREPERPRSRCNS